MDLLKDNQDLLQTNKKIMQDEMQKQIENLKQSQQELIKQNKLLRDSLNQIKIPKPSSALKRLQSDVVVR